MDRKKPTIAYITVIGKNYAEGIVYTEVFSDEEQSVCAEIYSALEQISGDPSSLVGKVLCGYTNVLPNRVTKKSFMEKMHKIFSKGK